MRRLHVPPVSGPASNSATTPSSRSDSDAVSTSKPRVTIDSAKTVAPAMITSALSVSIAGRSRRRSQGQRGKLGDQVLDRDKAQLGMMDKVPVIYQDPLVEANERGNCACDTDEALGEAKLRSCCDRSAHQSLHVRPQSVQLAGTRAGRVRGNVPCHARNRSRATRRPGPWVGRPPALSTRRRHRSRDKGPRPDRAQTVAPR